MKVVAINGSPKKQGNTALLINKILDGAKSNGAEIIQYDIDKMNVNGCKGCMHCRSEFKCAQKDDMAEILENLKEADVLVIGSPIYMWQVTGQAKIFLDRLYPVVNADFSPRLSNIKTATVYVQANPDESAFAPYIENTNSMLNFLGLNVVESIVNGGVGAPGDVLNHEDTLEQAFNIGKKLTE
ncbi:multimeric flavodoxin WrbA [Methanococcus maripaludis]|uniref:Multimeric flavodoxin WrbA n=1 Tax=Methanococcus maripaludis TaxID=39152 RepID=A0A7J9NN58_METMI|nr:flavodoxin family protein [Methanococcus maripaludis]MBA2846682.1 multimeric flavodoxin WrbA [Methanococcus maripaludis]